MGDYGPRELERDCQLDIGNKLKQLVSQLNLDDKIDFLGAKLYVELKDYLAQADIFVNLSQTGSLDKTVLEAMASKTLVLTSNEAFKSVLGDLADKLMFEPDNSQDLVDKVKQLAGLPSSQQNKIIERLQTIVLENHNLTKTIEKIINLY